MEKHLGKASLNYFSETNSKYRTKKDIYDVNGKLLLSKGQKVTDEIKEKLKRRGHYKPENLRDDKQEAAANPVVQTFEKRKSVKNPLALEKPYKIVSDILFESKSMPWRIYVNALSGYLDWVYTHSIDVAMISLLIAGELGFTDEDQRELGLGAFFHDVGKLLVPEAILQKPGPLDNTEIICLKQHCELGASSLNPFELPKVCMDIVLQHHERIDGSGYPKGLKEKEISCDAKIVMIADVLDEISSPRPYKPARTIGEAVNILQKDKEKYSQELTILLDKIFAIF